MDSTGERTGNEDLKLAGDLALAGAVVGVVANLVHPIIPADSTNEEFLAAVTGTSYWVPLHLLTAAGSVLLVAALFVALRAFTEPRARSMATVAAVIAAIGGTIFTVQIAGLDGIVAPALAETGASAEAVALLREIDVALLSLSIATFLGAAVAVLGVAMLRSAGFPGWLGWLAVVGGVGNLAVGTVQAVVGLSDITITYLFRPLAAIVTVAVFGFAIVLRRAGTAEATDRARPRRAPV